MLRRLQYPRRESNPYSPFGKQDFKSCASTCSATRVSTKKKSKHMGLDFWAAQTTLWAEDRARTGHPDLGKVVLYQMSYFRLFI